MGRWQEALRCASEALAVSHVLLWLRLDGLGARSGGVGRLPADLGVHLCMEAGSGASLSCMSACDKVPEALATIGATDEMGWEALELGSSLFSHGPRALMCLGCLSQPLPFLCDGDV